MFAHNSLIALSISAAALLAGSLSATAHAQEPTSTATSPASSTPSQLQTQSQQVYRWVDKTGKVFYSDQPPPADALQTIAKRVGGGSGSSNNEEVGYAAAEAARKNPVTLFVTPCGAECDNARKILSDRGVPHTVKNPELTKTMRDELERLSGALNVPFMVIGDAGMRGFNESTWNIALDNAGYPRAGVLTRKTKAKETAVPPAPAASAPAPTATPSSSAPTAGRIPNAQ